MSSEVSGPTRADAQRNRIRILTAAEEVFAQHGPGASTEEVARRAGVAVGTVFRHFPTKADLLRALMKRLLQQVTEDAGELIARHDPATSLFVFFERLVARTTANRAVVSLLSAEGVDVPVAGPLATLRDATGELLMRGQRAGAIRPEIRLDEVMALLVSTCQGALAGGWDHDLRRRTLDIVFAGLRAGSSSPPT